MWRVSKAVRPTPLLPGLAFARYAAVAAAAGWLAFPVLSTGQVRSGDTPGQRSATPSPDSPKDADNVEPNRTPPGKSKLHRLLDESASRYKLYAGNENAEPLELRCVLRWANLTRGSVDGATYIWIENGRPKATACVYPWAGMLCDNFQSLAEGKVTAVLNGGAAWRCEKPGVVFRAVPRASQPEKSSSGRIRQMKALASRFHTTLLSWNAAESDREELRMLPRPVYQYEHDGVAEGAIFAFVQGTDPEAFLLLEVRPRRQNGPQEYEWQFALARRTSGSLETSYDDELVWKAERLADYGDPKQPHFQVTRPFSPDAD